MLDAANYTPRLKASFKETIRGALKEEFGYSNDMMIPRLDKIVLNIGCGREAVKDSKKSESSCRGSVDHRWPAGTDDHRKELDRGLPCS